MVSFQLATVLLTGLATTGHATKADQRRKLSFQLIANYEPRSLVTDHNAIDLDQAEIERLVSLQTNDSFQEAKNVYERGAFSKSVARLTLVDGLDGPLSQGDTVTGSSEAGNDVAGTVYEDYSAGATEILVQYQTTEIQSSYVGCQVGANPNPNTEGCFSASGDITIDGRGTYSYAYTVGSDNINERTIQGFSLDAEEKMYRCENCPYLTYEKFYQYYGDFSYANSFVMAAFDGATTSFTNGNAAFGTYDFEGRAEAVKKGSAYMNVWMYVIREFEDALDDCKQGCIDCNDDPVHAWDEGVAFYSGSLESTNGEGDGVLLHQLADKRCANFKTCGDLGLDESGLSHVNIEIFRHFSEGQGKLLNGECDAARENKERIEQYMAVPLIQGTLRYAYIKEHEPTGGEKAEAEGAAFAASVLPLVHACNEDAANKIYNNMKVGQVTANFAEVKQSFEDVYKCMGLICEDIGGLWDPALGDYKNGAQPCGKAGKSSNNTGAIVGGIVGGLLGLAALLYVINSMCMRGHTRELPDSKNIEEGTM